MRNFVKTQGLRVAKRNKKKLYTRLRVLHYAFYYGAHPLLSARMTGLGPQYRVLSLSPDQSNQTRLQRYSNPANQGFCCAYAHASHQLSWPGPRDNSRY